MYLSAQAVNMTLPRRFEIASEAYVTYSAPSDALSYINSTIGGFAVGSTSYKFLNSITLSLSPIDSSKWICRIYDIPFLLGEGADATIAFENLKILIHVEFQRLLHKRPFQMTETERQKWKCFSNTLDVLYYKHTTPVTTCEIGKVSFGKIDRPFLIEWLSGHKYKIDPYKVPSDLMTCKPSQWIEATIKRDPINYSIVEVITAKKIHFRIPTENQSKTFWDRIPIIQNLTNV